MELQRSIGNRAVGILLQRLPAASPADPSEEFTVDGKRRVGPGHPLGPGDTASPGPAPTGPGPTPAAPAGPTAAAAAGPPTVAPSTGVSVSVAFSKKEPTITRAPARSIGATHGRSGAVGWTTPSFAVDLVPPGLPKSASFTASVGFSMELAEEYTGARYDILHDHELGHVKIGERTARTSLVEGLKSTLQAESSLNVAKVSSAMQSAIDQATQDEGDQSHAFDAADYPRMDAAYLGARTPLQKLSRTRDIGRMSKALERSTNVGGLSHSSYIAVANEIVAARRGLSAKSLAKLQYNAEFRSLVVGAMSTMESEGARLAVQLPTPDDGSPAGAGSSVEGREADLARSMVSESLLGFAYTANPTE